jgi:ATP/ADP translocase
VPIRLPNDPWIRDVYTRKMGVNTAATLVLNVNMYAVLLAFVFREWSASVLYSITSLWPLGSSLTGCDQLA